MLAAGTRFGPYEIQSLLGAGGMGEVYRARDTTLHRLVAIKVLPDSFARDPERIARFEREARTLASLNHPNIGAIFGFQNEGGRHALVLELVEGPTLADRIAGGALPVAESLAMARQIASALDAAHQQGIVHRDLKPANVKVREDGTVKVLDFGLARALAPDAAPDITSAPTITSPAVLTGAGVIMGSAAYMAPEQAKGVAADKRADIWAFGCVLYEMLTGRHAFDGAGVTDTLASVLRGEPDWTALPADLAAATRTLLTRCLEKDRSERVQDISTARFVLAEQASLSGSYAAPPPRPSARRPRASWWIAAAALAGLAAGGAGVWFATARPLPSAHTARFDLSEMPDVDVFGAAAAISPDGTSVVYSSRHNGVPQLMLRRFDRLDTAPIAGTEAGVDPFFSPDGREIGFIRAGEMRRISIDGGNSFLVWRGDPTFEGAAWRADGTIVFSHDASLYRVNAGGGERVKVASPDAQHDETGYDRPVFLPDGDTLLYTVEVRGGGNRVAARRLSGGAPVTLVEDGFGAQYLPSGYLVFARRDRLWAARFDVTTLRVSGTPTPLEDGVFTGNTEGISSLSIAADGTAAFIAGHNSGHFGRLTWLDRTGRRTGRLIDDPLEHPRNMRLSPDGTRLALTVGAPGQGNIWVYDVAGKAPPVKLTFRDHNTFPVWSPDGTRIAYMKMAGDSVRSLVLAADGSSVQEQPLAMTGLAGAPIDWSGSTLIMYRELALRLLRPPDAHESTWMEAPFAFFNARVSPDGRWLAYTSTQNGRPDVWVHPFQGSGPTVRVSANGGHEPVWSHDGRELFFTYGTTLLSAKVLSLDPEARFDTPRQLFEGGFAYDIVDPLLRYYDVTPDGRFLVVEPVEPNKVAVVVAQHWDEALKAAGAK